MSLRRNFLSRRISNRSFTLSSKSVKELKNLEIVNRYRIYDVNNNKSNAVRSGDDGAEQHGVVSVSGDGGVETTPSLWSSMLLELLGEIIQRVEASEDKWPLRRNLVACGCVCKGWREVTKDVASSSSHHDASAKITFPSCLKKGTFLLAARRYGKGTHSEYIVSLDPDDFSQGSNAYVGKLRSDFLGTNFTVYVGQPPHNGAKPSSSTAAGLAVVSPASRLVHKYQRVILKLAKYPINSTS